MPRLSRHDRTEGLTPGIGLPLIDMIRSLGRCCAECGHWLTGAKRTVSRAEANSSGGQAPFPHATLECHAANGGNINMLCMGRRDAPTY